MNQIKYRLMQFMRGRNGIDPLGYATMVLYFLLFLVNSFVGGIYPAILGYLIVILMFYRMLSRNIARRRSENAQFMRVFGKAKAFTKQTGRRMKDIRTHRYRTCPSCKVTLRLPVKRGKHTVVCPRCKQKVQVRVWL